VLFEHAVNDLAERGFRTGMLWTLATNDRAKRFYERAGWRLDGAEKTDRMDEFELNEVRYRIDLRPP
jgi:ribosomal protein S18 acetylase RimI-like enzyme